MYTTYDHAHTVNISLPFVRQEYGTKEEIKLGSDSNRIKMHYPIRSQNIQARLSIPDDAEVVLPDEGTLFSLDNLVERVDHNFTFRTRYLDLSRIRETNIVRQEYTPEEACLKWEKEKVGNYEELFGRYQTLLTQVIGKSRINSLADVGIVLEYVDSKINEWESGPGKTARQIIDELEETNSYEGNCTERQTLTRWLLSVGSVRNRTIEGRCGSEEGIFEGQRYSARRVEMHAWNEFMVTNGSDDFWIPMDGGNIPYLREDSLLVHYLPTQLPKVVSKNGETKDVFDCVIELDQI
jgi:hypothetical protein